MRLCRGKPKMWGPHLVLLRMRCCDTGRSKCFCLEAGEGELGGARTLEFPVY